MSLDAEVEVIDYEWERLVLRFSIASRRSIADILMQQAKLAIREMANILPPMSTLTGKESWAAQRRIQVNAIHSQLSRVFITRSKVYREIKERVSPQAAAGWWRASIEDPARAAAMLRSMPINYRTLPLGEAPDPAEHRRARVRGRVPKSERGRQIVLKQARLKRYHRDTIAKIGRLKGGMVPAADRLGVTGIPAWVRKNAGPGLVVIRNDNPNDPSIRIANLVRYAGYHNRGNRLMNIVFSNRAKAMERQLKAASRGQWRGAVGT